MIPTTYSPALKFIPVVHQLVYGMTRAMWSRCCCDGDKWGAGLDVGWGHRSTQDSDCASISHQQQQL